MTRYRFIGDPNDNFSGPDMLEWFGLIFSRDDWTEVPEGLIAKIDGHTHFERQRGRSAEAVEAVVGAGAVTARGAAAKASGKPRNVPPAYRGKPEEGRWLAGYDNA